MSFFALHRFFDVCMFLDNCIASAPEWAGEALPQSAKAGSVPRLRVDAQLFSDSSY